MKAISLWQPWASLMEAGSKTIETRGWKTEYRGDLLICSTKSGLKKSELEKLLLKWEFQEGLSEKYGTRDNYGLCINWPGVEIEDLPLGMALCVVELQGCIKTDKLISGNCAITRYMYCLEREFGDYSPGRFAWITTNLRPIKPFPVKGQQGLFNVDDSLIEFI